MTQVAITHVAARGPYVAGAAPAEAPLANPRARKMMSRAAYLAAYALADLVRQLAPSAADRTELGYFLGVGGSAGALDDVTALLDASFVDGAFSLPRFGDRGLAACNPLLAFQLMNNFTMCHGAILENLSGPNAALFSRGAGTVAALAEAHHAVRSGECARAIAGGADVPTHPVTLAELARDGHLGRGLVPADGAALLALAASTRDDDVVVLDGCAHASGRGRALAEAIDDAVARALRVASSSSASDAGVPDAPTAVAPTWAHANPPASRDEVAAATSSESRHASSSSRNDGARPPFAPTWAQVNLDEVDHVVASPWGPPARDALRSYAAARFPRATFVDATSPGETLAAGAAFALIAAVDVLRARSSEGLDVRSLESSRSSTASMRVVVLTLGVDGDPGVMLVSRGGVA